MIHFLHPWCQWNSWIVSLVSMLLYYCKGSAGSESIDFRRIHDMENKLNRSELSLLSLIRYLLSIQLFTRVNFFDTIPVLQGKCWTREYWYQRIITETSTRRLWTLGTWYQYNSYSYPVVSVLLWYCKESQYFKVLIAIGKIAVGKIRCVGMVDTAFNTRYLLSIQYRS